MNFKNIDQCTDKNFLYENLSDEKLQMIEDVLAAYASGKIDMIIPRYEDGEPDFYGHFELVISDKTYIPNGFECLILKWSKDFEDTGYLIEVLK